LHGVGLPLPTLLVEEFDFHIFIGVRALAAALHDILDTLKISFWVFFRVQLRADWARAQVRTPKVFILIEGKILKIDNYN